nr:hypothetical protein BaRGS_000244 [Batillaria attramentaria]
MICRYYNVTHSLHSGDVVRSVIPSSVSPQALRNYGLWKACDMGGQCDRVWNKVEDIAVGAVVASECLATVAFIGYACCVLLELASHIRIVGSLLATNRITELVLGASAVLHFLTMMVFTGEVKNRARRAPDSLDQACWGFRLTAVSGTAAVLVVMVMGLFRHVPRWRRPRRHWKLPGHLAKFNRQQAAASTTKSSF